MPCGAFKEGSEFLPIIRPPGLCLRRVEKVFLDGGLHAEGQFRLDPVQFVETVRTPGARNRDSQPISQAVCVPLVPRPFDAFPVGRGNAIPVDQLPSVAGDGCNHFVPRGEKDPSLQVQSTYGFQKEIDGLFWLSKGGRPDGVGRVPRESPDRILVVDEADGYPVAPETPDDAQAVKVAAEDHRAYILRRSRCSWKAG